MRENIPSNHSESNNAAWHRFHNYWLDQDAPATPLRLLYKELIETRFEPESWAQFEALERKIIGCVADAKEIINTQRDKEKSNANKS